MWKAATVFFALALIATLIGIEVVRSIVHARRERRTGIGGTQDIAMWGTMIGLALLVATVVSGVGWFLTK